MPPGILYWVHTSTQSHGGGERLQTYIDPANVSTSSDVKSGATNSSFSKSLLHGNFGISVGAESTRRVNAFVRSLFIIATKFMFSYSYGKSSEETRRSPPILHVFLLGLCMSR